MSDNEQPQDHQAQVVGALACQRNSYLETLEAVVVSCVKQEANQQQNGSKKKSKSSDASPPPDIWLIEFSDSVLFPEGGGQPSDHGTIQVLSELSSESIPIQFVQRVGLRCVYHSPKPLSMGDRVRQSIDVKRRRDHMQQHTGQHLLSAVMNTYDNLHTLGWGIGNNGDMNYVDLPRKPSDAELEDIQNSCNELISQNLTISVDSPSDAKQDRIPGDYDKDKGIIRVVSIGGLDQNTCCGTHLGQTSHISLILLGSTQTVHGKNCRLSFITGQRAVDLSSSSVKAVRSMARLWSSSQSADDVEAAAVRTNNALADAKKREKALLAEIGDYEASRIKEELQSRKAIWVYRADCGLDFFTGILAQVKDMVKSAGAVIVMVSGEARKSGSVVIFGEPNLVQAFMAKAQGAVEGIKGGGKGEKWQGKVPEWKKGQLESLKELTLVSAAQDLPIRVHT